MSHRWRERFATGAVALIAGAVAAASARPWVGGWNDGSRLATVESLVDRHTLAIDDSIFVRAGATQDAAVPVLTQDKLFVDGHYFSDKPPVPSLLMAGLYQLWRWGGGDPAAQRPGPFCYWMTLASSGTAYVVAVVGVFLIGATVGLGPALRVWLTASFGLATVALPYARHVNGHIVLLGVATLLFLLLLLQAPPRRAALFGRVALGTLAGAGYAIDPAAGPLLLASIVALLAARRDGRGVALVIGAAAPWLALHHALNYAVGGTVVPANSVPAYLQWPGSPFDRAHMTGIWQHQNLGHLFVYAVGLLIGKRGFLLHNLPLLLAVPGAAIVWRRRPPEMPELACGAAWCASTWLVYAAASSNYSGVCASIRWFVPLLVPGYLCLSVALREYPPLRVDLAVLSAWGSLLAAWMWWEGPWMSHQVPFFWGFQAAALASWFACWARRRRDGALDAAAARGRPHLEPGWRASSSGRARS